MKVDPGKGKETSATPAACCAGAILSGGRSRRMGGGVKALADLAGKPLVQHVIDRLAPQVRQVMISVETAIPGLESFGLEQVPDPEPGSNGPLGGLAAVLSQLDGSGCQWLLMVPCDAPFLPLDLGRNLLRKAESEQTKVAVVRYGSELQPTFSLWNVGLCGDLNRAVSKDRMAGFKQYLRGTTFSVLDWPSSPLNPFFNINDASALEYARKMMCKQTGSTA